MVRLTKRCAGPPAAATPRMALFLAVREDALPGARCAAGQQPTRRGFPGSVPNLIQTGPVGRLNVSDTNTPIRFCRAGWGSCLGLIGTGEPRLSFPGRGLPPHRKIVRMVILQTTIISLIIVAASIAARVIAATDHRLSFTAITSKIESR